jgi:hypothetical protein
METGQVFGLNIGDLLGIYDPDSQSWKTSELSLFGGLMPFSGRFPKSGIMLNGKIYEQATWAHRTGGKESGLWPTPTTQEIESECELNERGRRIQKTGDGSRGLNLARKVKFPTPHSNCHTGAGKRGDGGENLQTAVMWPTPQSRDYKGKSQRGADPQNRDCLPNAVMNQKMWPTPDANCGNRGTQPEWKPIRESGQTASYTLNQATRDTDGPTGQLNPQFVEWLMGYPMNYTDMRDGLRLSLIRE